MPCSHLDRYCKSRDSSRMANVPLLVMVDETMYCLPRTDNDVNCPPLHQGRYFPPANLPAMRFPQSPFDHSAIVFSLCGFRDSYASSILDSVLFATLSMLLLPPLLLLLLSMLLQPPLLLLLLPHCKYYYCLHCCMLLHRWDRNLTL